VNIGLGVRLLGSLSLGALQVEFVMGDPGFKAFMDKFNDAMNQPAPETKQEEEPASIDQIAQWSSELDASQAQGAAAAPTSHGAFGGSDTSQSSGGGTE
jgi:hypothetical protein